MSKVEDEIVLDDTNSVAEANMISSPCWLVSSQQMFHRRYVQFLMSQNFASSTHESNITSVGEGQFCGSTSLEPISHMM